MNLNTHFTYILRWPILLSMHLLLIDWYKLTMVVYSRRTGADPHSDKEWAEESRRQVPLKIRGVPPNVVKSQTDDAVSMYRRKRREMVAAKKNKQSSQLFAGIYPLILCTYSYTTHSYTIYSYTTHSYITHHIHTHSYTHILTHTLIYTPIQTLIHIHTHTQHTQTHIHSY